MKVQWKNGKTQLFKYNYLHENITAVISEETTIRQATKL